MKTKYIIFICILFSSILASAGSLGEELPLFSIVPFIGILLSIAVVPLLAPIFWHRNFGKISAFWAISFLLPFIIWIGFDEALHQFLHVILLEYIPFILLLLALFTISGGIRLKGYLAGTPKVNTLILLIGTALASWMGTTGAAMLLIRPILRANKTRKNKIHTIIFFIFLVANIGGSLTPLGDPPLFLGFLHGINFFWTTKALFVPMLVSSVILLIAYFLLDTYYYKRENHSVNEDQYKEPLSIDGKGNFILLAGVILAVLMSGFWKPDISDISIHGIHLTIPNIMRDISLVLLTLISWRFTDLNIRNQNGFTWFPILEVAKLFAGIFITIIPAIAILRAGQKGVMGAIINLVTDTAGNPVNTMYFWLTGLLSGFLDNAPTYLVFFNIAGSSAPENMEIADYLMYGIPDTLMAISLGAVFMGAMTYIGNAPNFMVKSIAEENDITMPSFFGYMLWSILILIPVFIIVSFTMI
jgi:Na+/H+ antiporter NhaD/arsenite permease-like protein